MAEISWGAVVAVLAVLVSVCSVAAFLLGRKKAASDEGTEKGKTISNMQHVTDAICEMKISVERLGEKIDLSNKEMSQKIDTANKEREGEYRQMLVAVTELKSSYKSLHKRVDFIQDKMKIQVPKLIEDEE